MKGALDAEAPAVREFLVSDDIVDWQHPDVRRLSQSLAAGGDDAEAVTRACYEWVRDRVAHTVDAGLQGVTCRASEVLRLRTGYCYAKSHLLAALLRANGIPAGFCYQRLRQDGRVRRFACTASMRSICPATAGTASTRTATGLALTPRSRRRWNAWPFPHAYPGSRIFPRSCRGRGRRSWKPFCSTARASG